MKSVSTTGAAAAVLLAIALAGCDKPNNQLVQSTTPSTTSPTTTSSHTAAIGVKAIKAETVTVGSTGVRCLVGNMSTACAATTRPFKDGDHEYWTATLSLTAPYDLEPGFQPGQPVDPSQLAVGDIAVTGGTVGVVTTMGASPKVSVGKRVIDIGDIAGIDFDGFYRPDPGKTLALGQPLAIRDWKFTLTGSSLEIDAPNGGFRLET